MRIPESIALKRIFFFTLLSILLSPRVNAQTFEWAKQIGGGGRELTPSIVVDTAGNIFTSGYFAGTVDFDPGEEEFSLSSVGEGDNFITKSDPNGDLLWAMRLSEEDAWTGFAKVDRYGNTIIHGIFYGTIDFDFGPETYELTSLGDSAFFILKLDTDGDFLWAISIDGVSDSNLSIDLSGNIICLGKFFNVVDFDPGVGSYLVTPPMNNAYFILKLSSSGSFGWVKIFNTGHFVHFAFDINNNIFLSGQFIGTFDFDPGPGVHNLTATPPNQDFFSLARDIYVLKLNSAGEFQWANQIGGPLAEAVSSIEVDDTGKLYMAGGFYDIVDFGPGGGDYTLTSSGEDGFICKLDLEGNFEWVKQISSPQDYAFFSSVVVDSEENVYACGHFINTATILPFEDPIVLTSAGDSDMLIMKFNPSGNPFWVKQLGGPLSEYNGWNYNMAVDGEDNLLISGLFQGTVDFDLGPETYEMTSNGDYDIFILKMNGDYIGPQDFFSTSCDSYTWPVNGVTYSSSGTYTAEITESEETVLHTLHLTLIEEYSESVFSCNSFTWSENDITYTESGNYQVVYTNVAGCDSIVALNLTLGYTYTDTQTVTACESYTWPVNGETYTESALDSLYIPINGPNQCDSILRLDLTIDSSTDVSATISENTLTANNPDASYQWLDCNADFAPIEGETSQSFTPLENGSYAVEVSGVACADTSDCITVSTIGILENTFSQQIKVYPNPTRGLLKIELGKMASLLEISVRNVEGKVVAIHRLENSNMINMELEGSSGVYFVELLSSDKEKALIRVVKE